MLLVKALTTNTSLSLIVKSRDRAVTMAREENQEVRSKGANAAVVRLFEALQAS